MSSTTDIERVFREQSGRAIASLVRHFGDLDVAEEAVQDAFMVALEHWPRRGVPPSPTGWIITTAKHRAIDRLRREATRGTRHDQAAASWARDEPEEPRAVDDDHLRLIFTCCHPALAPEARVALTLRLVAGLSTNEIARAFLVPPTTLVQRIVRAKQKIKATNLPYRIPEEPAELRTRLRSVLAVIYLVFNEGYVATEGERLVRAELCGEAIRLARVVVDLLPREPEGIGLLALLLLTESRRPARTDHRGALVRLADQDRSRWNLALIEEGQALVRACLVRNDPGPYQIQAAIAAVHSDAAGFEATDWSQIIALYDQLLRFTPTPIVRLNRAIALAEVEGPAAALSELHGLGLDAYHLYHAACADMLERLGRTAEARVAYDTAVELAHNASERELLEHRRAELGALH